MRQDRRRDKTREMSDDIYSNYLRFVGLFCDCFSSAGAIPRFRFDGSTLFPFGGVFLFVWGWVWFFEVVGVRLDRFDRIGLVLGFFFFWKWVLGLLFAGLFESVEEWRTGFDSSAIGGENPSLVAVFRDFVRCYGCSMGSVEFNEVFNGIFNRKVNGMLGLLNGMLDGMWDGMLDGIFNGMFNGMVKEKINGILRMLDGMFIRHKNLIWHQLTWAVESTNQSPSVQSIQHS